MLTHLLRTHPLDGSLWIIVALLQYLVVLAIFHGRTLDKYRAFALYVCFAALKTTLLMVVPPGPGFRVYTWISFPWATVQCVLMAVCVADLYSKALGPKISLPEWAPRNLGLLLGISAATGTALGLIFKPEFGDTPADNAIEWFGMAQSAMCLGMALALWILILYTVRLGISWWPRDAQIAGGIVLLLTVNAAALVVIWTCNRQSGFVAQRIGQLAEIFALGWWSWKLWEKEPALRTATEEQLQAVLASHRENMGAVRMAKKAMG